MVLGVLGILGILGIFSIFGIFGINDYWRDSRKDDLEETFQNVRKFKKKWFPNPPKSRPGASKIEPRALQDTIFKGHAT